VSWVIQPQGVLKSNLESSLISVLSHEELDNGNGKARLHTLRYRHEIESGLTSSNSNQIMAFDSFGNVVKNSWNQDAILSASKLLTFIDTCGHFKYQKTTLSALVGSNADMFMLVQAANEPLSNEFIEYFKILNLMAVPMMACITKIDISSSEQVTRVILQLFSLLKSFNVTSRIIQNEKDIVSYKPDTLPLFFTSSVKSNFSNLTNFLFGIKVRSPVLSNEEVIFQSQHIFNLSNVGTVLSGLILTGQIDLESGPTSLLLQTGSKSIRVIVKSIERYKTRVYSASAGQLVTLALKFPIDDTLECHTWINHPPNNFTLKKGMILSNISFKPQKSFIADIKWLGLPNMQIESIIAGMLYIGYARKAVKLCPIANNRAKICFLADEIIIPPIKMIFVNSKMKCIVGLCDEH
jgi:GTPase